MSFFVLLQYHPVVAAFKLIIIYLFLSHIRTRAYPPTRVHSFSCHGGRRWRWRREEGRLVVPVVPINTRVQSTIISKARVNRHSRRDPVLASHFLIAHTITSIYILTTFVLRARVCVCVYCFFFVFFFVFVSFF